MDIKISGTQFSFIIFNVITATLILSGTGLIVESARQSAWAAAIGIPFVAGFIALWLSSQLCSRFHKKNLLAISEVLLGRVIGKVISFAYLIYFLNVSILIAIEYSNAITTQFLPETPRWALSAFIVTICGYAVYKGLEGITRSIQFVVPIFVATYVITQFLSINHMELINLRPLFEGGLTPIIRGSIIPTAWFGQVIIAAMLIPTLNKPQEAIRKGTIALAMATVMITIDTLSTLLIFGPNFGALLQYPLIDIARYIKVALIIQRLELLITAGLTIVIFTKLALFYTLACLAVEELIGKSYRKACLTLGLIQIVVATFAFSNIYLFTSYLKIINPIFELSFEIALPILLWLLATVGRYKREQTV